MGCRLLIVDDEIPAVQGLMDLMDFKKIGITKIEAAYSMEEAIRQFETDSVNLLLTDIEMPGGSGLDLIAWVKEHVPSCVTIILSSFPNFAFAQRAITLGVFEYLLKPVDDEKLEEVLCRAVVWYREYGQEQEEKAEDPLIATVKDYIYDHISEEISRDEIAEYVNLSPAYLSTFFKRETGGTLTDFIKTERIHFAKKLLRQTNLSISSIAQNVGYDSLAYFSSIFRSVTGCTPREYRSKF